MKVENLYQSRENQKISTILQMKFLSVKVLINARKSSEVNLQNSINCNLKKLKLKVTR